MINIFCDGGCIVGKNIGAESHVMVEDNKIICMSSSLIDGWGRLTNNMAEYQAIIEALNTAEEYQLKHFTIFSDSEIVIRQITGQYECKESTLVVMLKEVKYHAHGKEVEYCNVPRTNKFVQIADKMNKIIMNEAKHP